MFDNSEKNKIDNYHKFTTDSLFFRPYKNFPPYCIYSQFVFELLSVYIQLFQPGNEVISPVSL